MVFFDSSVNLEISRSCFGFLMGSRKNCDNINLKIVNFGLVYRIVYRKAVIYEPTI